jgi:hypothetical protein
MTYALAILIITVCSLLHDGDYLSKGKCVAIHALGLAFITGGLTATASDMSLIFTLNNWYAVAASLASVGIFWGVFRRGLIAQAELTALNAHDDATMYRIVKEYPPYLGYVPMWITKFVVTLPYQAYHRRIQSGLIALLLTAPISAIPVWGGVI